MNNLSACVGRSAISRGHPGWWMHSLRSWHHGYSCTTPTWGLGLLRAEVANPSHPLDVLVPLLWHRFPVGLSVKDTGVHTQLPLFMPYYTLLPQTSSFSLRYCIFKRKYTNPEALWRSVTPQTAITLFKDKNDKHALAEWTRVKVLC